MPQQALQPPVQLCTHECRNFVHVVAGSGMQPGGGQNPPPGSQGGGFGQFGGLSMRHFAYPSEQSVTHASHKSGAKMAYPLHDPRSS
jgi:hypothetical protein